MEESQRKIDFTPADYEMMRFVFVPIVMDTTPSEAIKWHAGKNDLNPGAAGARWRRLLKKMVAWSNLENEDASTECTPPANIGTAEHDLFMDVMAHMLVHAPRPPPDAFALLHKHTGSNIKQTALQQRFQRLKTKVKVFVLGEEAMPTTPKTPRKSRKRRLSEIGSDEDAPDSPSLGASQRRSSKKLKKSESLDVDGGSDSEDDPTLGLHRIIVTEISHHGWSPIDRPLEHRRLDLKTYQDEPDGICYKVLQ
ncbi:hypothetical protein PYCC9005_004523 [Savitreella phatthalungensis]